MYKKREYVDGAFYHVTSRTNNKVRVFENNMGRKIMIITLQDAKDKFHFRLTNFCVMPTHVHLLIQPKEGSSLSSIMHWIKIHAAKRWNFIHGSVDHMWGSRYFARTVRNYQDYETIMDYIDQNPVKAGLATVPAEWKASGAFYKAHNLPDLVDFDPEDQRKNTILLSPIPFLVSNLLPPAQLEHTMKYYGVYATKMKQLYMTVSGMPMLGDTDSLCEPHTYFHYYTGTADYFIFEYDRQDTMYGKVCMNVYPEKTEYTKISLAALKKNPFLRLEW